MTGSKGVTVLDPFAGGGAIPFEAARLGFDTIANELNPVAVAILNGTVELPASLGVAFSDVIEHGEGDGRRELRKARALFPQDRR